jgi:hypothetical protein
VPDKALFGGLLKAGRITEQDVALLRADIFADDRVDLDEAQLVFRLAAECSDKDPAWDELYVDALTDYYVWHAPPRGYVSEHQSAELVAHLLREGRLTDAADLELLLNIVYWAGYCPGELVSLVVEAVSQSVLDPDNAVYGRDRMPRVIEAIDVEILRRAIYAPATDGGLVVSRAEAELLFELNNITVDSANNPAWSGFFVTAIANCMMYPSAATGIPTPEEVRRRTAWLRERRGIRGLLYAIGNSWAEEAFEDDEIFGTKDQIERERRAEARRRALRACEPVGREAADWLVEQVGKDGVLHRNEQALLSLIKRNSPDIHPALHPLFEQADLS